VEEAMIQPTIEDREDWWEEAQREGEEAEALWEWFGEFIEHYAKAVHSRDVPGIEILSNLHQMRDAFGRVWGLPATTKY
jgi:hypothetical protein